MAQDLQRSDAPLYRLEAIDFGRRMAVEKEIEKTETAPPPNAIFDESSNFLIYATLLGIKVIYHIPLISCEDSDYWMEIVLATLCIVLCFSPLCFLL